MCRKEGEKEKFGGREGPYMEGGTRLSPTSEWTALIHNGNDNLP